MLLDLAQERTRFVHLRQRLLELYPEVDDQTLADTLEGATNLKEAVTAVIRSAIEDEFLAKSLRERIEGLKQRLSRFEARAAGKRSMAVEAMQRSDCAN